MRQELRVFQCPASSLIIQIDDNDRSVDPRTPPAIIPLASGDTERALIDEPPSAASQFEELAELRQIRRELGDARYAPWTDVRRAFVILRFGNAHATNLLRTALQSPRRPDKIYRLLWLTKRCVAAPYEVLEKILSPMAKTTLPSEVLARSTARLSTFLPVHLRASFSSKDALLCFGIASGTRPIMEWQQRGREWKLRPDHVFAMNQFRSDVYNRSTSREIIGLFLGAV